jgi:hypothetical protein
VLVELVSVAVTVHTVFDVGRLAVIATAAGPLITPPPPTTTLPVGHVAVALFGEVLSLAETVPVICW